jgi:uncharacterized coiled-coil DUF342 family protein
MAELLEELEQKRQVCNNEAEKHRHLRDELNEQTKEWVTKRDELNAKVRELVEEAAKHRETRDSLNVRVKEDKEQRDLWNQKVNELNEKVLKLKKDNLPREGPPIAKLKKELKALEFKQMTSVLTTEKERGIIEMLSALQAQIKERERALEQNVEVRNAIRELREAKDKAEIHHKNVGELAEKAQAEHDMMIELYEQADGLRKVADAAQENFIETKLKADEEHRKHIESIRQVHDYDKIITGLRQKARRAKKKKEESTAMQEAEQIFEQFKKGEKLSTEDIMTLQKSGYL